MYERILVPLDGSAASEQALIPAAALAARNDAELHVVAVQEPEPIVVKSDPVWSGELRRHRAQYLADRTAALCTEGRHVVTAVRDGVVVPTLCDYAREHAIDLIVITTHGRTGLSRFWLGSVADGIMRHASVPVLMVRPTEAPASGQFESVVVPVDGSPLSEQVLPHALALAAGGRATVTLVRVVEFRRLAQEVPAMDMSVPPFYPSPMVDEQATGAATSEAKAYLRGLAGTLRESIPTVAVDTVVVAGDKVVEALLDVIKAHQADAVAIATHGRGMSRLLAGSVADKIIRGCELPVLMLRPAMD